MCIIHCICTTVVNLYISSIDISEYFFYFLYYACVCVFYIRRPAVLTACHLISVIVCIFWTDLTDSRPDRFSFAHRFCSSFQFSVKRSRLSIHLQAFKRAIYFFHSFIHSFFFYTCWWQIKFSLSLHVSASKRLNLAEDQFINLLKPLTQTQSLTLNITLLAFRLSGSQRHLNHRVQATTKESIFIFNDTMIQDNLIAVFIYLLYRRVPFHHMRLNGFAELDTYWQSGRQKSEGSPAIDISWLVRTIHWVQTTGPHQDDAKT